MFADSPLTDATSPYDPGYYKLASGGKVYQPQPDVGKPGTTTPNLDTLTGLDPALVAQLAPGMLIKDNSGTGSPIPQSTTVLKIIDATTIQMSNKATAATTRNYTFDGSRFTGEFHTATGDASTLIPTNPADVANLLEGMLVTGQAGIPAGTRILKKAPDNSSITLTNPVPASTGAQYTFSGGIADANLTKLTNLWYAWAKYYSTKQGMAEVPYTTAVNPPELSFDAANLAQADAFAKQVYDVMIGLSKIAPIDNRLTPSTQLMDNVIGCNVGSIPGISTADKQKLTDEVISVMRGVVNSDDHTTVPDWYSAPTDATKFGGAMIKYPGAATAVKADFNVYNLNPFVWFVHKKLGISGYAFSVDDGIADVGAEASNSLLVTIGNITDSTNGRKLPNMLPYGKHSKWGPVVLDAKQVNPTTLKIVNKPDQWKLGQISAGATVSSSGGDVQRGTTVQGLNNTQFWIVLDPNKPMTPSTVKNTYKFYDPGVNGPL